jgi:hypothetical protein
MAISSFLSNMKNYFAKRFTKITLAPPVELFVELKLIKYLYW